MTDTSKLELPDLRGSVEIDFYTEPVRHKSNRLYRDFVEDFKRELAPHNWQTFVGEVEVIWTLFQDQHTRETTDRIADLDNLVKGLNDCIKGPDGLMIDDSQIQSLTVRWVPLEAPTNPRVRLRINDPFNYTLREPLRLYQMADKLYYPVHAENTRVEHYIVNMLDELLRRTNEMGRKHHGDDENALYEYRRHFGPNAQGFMKTRIAESGYEIFSYEDWRPTVSEDVETG